MEGNLTSNYLKFQIKKKKMKTKQAFFLPIVVITALVTSCSSPTGPVNNSLTLSVDVSCTEAWLKLSANNVSLPKGITITRDGNNLFSFTLTTKDTTLYDSTLAPNKSYTYQAKINLIGGQSDKIVVTTFDTTSHNFTWQTFTFGDPGAGSSTLNDVAIVNDTLAYAVGEIYMNDSTGQPDPNAYNLAKWNGHTWQLFKIQFYTFCGQEHTGSYKANAVAVLNDTTVWIASNNSQIAVWNGNKQTGIMCLPVSVSKIWAANKNDVYTVGALGQIGHYTNGSWQKIESGTTVRLLDVYGTSDGKTVWISGYEDFKPTVLLKYSNNSLTTVINDQSHLLNYTPAIISGAIESIWTNNNNMLFLLTWYGLYRINSNTNREVKNLWSGDPNTWALIKVRGNNVNDIIAAGIRGRIWHYNGVSWKFYTELENNTDTYYSIAVKGDTYIAAGYRYVNGVIRYGLVKVAHR